MKINIIIFIASLLLLLLSFYILGESQKLIIDAEVKIKSSEARIKVLTDQYHKEVIEFRNILNDFNRILSK